MYILNGRCRDEVIFYNDKETIVPVEDGAAARPCPLPPSFAPSAQTWATERVGTRKGGPYAVDDARAHLGYCGRLQS